MRARLTASPHSLAEGGVDFLIKTERNNPFFLPLTLGLARAREDHSESHLEADR